MPSIPDPTSRNPDPLGRLTDQLVADLVALLTAEDKVTAGATFARTLSTWSAELIGRAAAQAASVSTPIIAKVEDLERRERRRSEKLEAVQREMNGQIDAVHRHMPPDLTDAVHRLAVEVEQLKERQAGGDDDGQRG